MSLRSLTEFLKKGEGETAGSQHVMRVRCWGLFPSLLSEPLLLVVEFMLG